MEQFSLGPGKTCVARLILALTCTAMLAGCFGYQKPGRDLTISCNAPGPELYARGSLYGSGCEMSPPPTYTKKDVREMWGAPDNEYVADGVDHWVYEKRAFWGFIYFFVPIPIPVPRFDYRADLTFSDENLKSIHIRRGTRTGSVCGLLPSPEYVPFFPGCSAFREDSAAEGYWIAQERSDDRQYPPGTRMVRDEQGIRIEEPLDDVQHCATPVVSAAEQSEVEAILGPLVTARTVERDVWNREHQRDPWLRRPPWPERLINVHFHVITSGDGRVGRLEAAEIDALMARLNFNFSGTDFQFKLIGTDYTSNDSWFHMTPGSTEERAAKAALRKGTSGDINIYTAEPKGGLHGWATFPWSYHEDPASDGVVTLFSLAHAHPEKRWGGRIAHQMGHWAGLYHTFQGGCEVPGDWVSDTGPQKSPTPGCPSSRKSCGDAYEAVHNPMNFSDDECIWGFTPQQGDRMSAAFALYRDGK